MPSRFPITELFGYPHDNNSLKAAQARRAQYCPFLDAACAKPIGHKGFHLGNCSVYRNKYGPIITCPKRFSGGSYHIVDDRARALMDSSNRIVKIPEVQMTPILTADWVALDVLGDGIINYCNIEIQTIDITDSIAPYLEAFLTNEGWESIRHTYGINWANVFKRLLPQLVGKGAIMASYKKKTGVIIQDVLLDYMLRRMSIGEERDPAAANLVFYGYALRLNKRRNAYQLQLGKVLQTSVDRLTAASIARGALPSQKDFEQILMAKSGLHF